MWRTVLIWRNLHTCSLFDYLRQSEERLLKSAWGRRNHSEVEHPNDYKKEVAGNESLSWLAVGDLKKDTEDPIMAGQDQVLRTSVIKANIEHKRVSALCRMCGKCQKGVEQNTQYVHVAAANLPKEITKRGKLTHWPGLFNENFAKSISGVESGSLFVTENFWSQSDSLYNLCGVT